MQIIYLDISNKGVIPTIYAKQGDVGRKFQVVLTDSGLAYNPTVGSVFSVWYSGASGEGNYTDIGENPAFSLSGNKVIVEMIAQMLLSEGDGVLSLVLNDPNGNQISTWNIPYVCEFVPGSDSEEAQSYYTAFSKAVENLPNPDTSLSIPGKSADAKAVGDLTINGKSIRNNPTLNADDVGARSNTWMPSASQVGAVPTSRTVNGKELSKNIVLTAEDVKAETRKLLWVNAYTGSAFPAQTISLDLSGYNAIEVVGFVGHPPANTFSSGIVPIGNSGAIHGLSSDFWMHSRAFTTNFTGVTFESGAMKEPNASIYTGWDARSIPYKIYGIKEVQ